MTPPAWLAEVSRLADGLTIRSPVSFTLLGDRYDTGDQAVGPAPGSVLSTAAQTQLADALYLTLHCRRDSGVVGYRDPVGAREFARQLSQANDGLGPWQPGWVVRAIENDGRIVAEQYGVRFWLPSDQFRSVGSPAAPGTVGSVRLPSEFQELAGSFYMVLGNADDETEQVPQVRVYWHVTAAGAADLTRRLTRRLNEAEIPFRFKVVNDPTQFQRTDAAVLYLARERYAVARPAIAATYADVVTRLRAPVSAYVRRLAPGLGLAEDPDDGSSLGQHRSWILAAALASAEAAGAANRLARDEVLLDAVRSAELDPIAFHLAPGSADRYDGIATTPARAVADTAMAGDQDPLPPDAALDVVHRLADHLCRTALWDRNRCTWLGMVQDTDDDDEMQVCCETLGPDVYAGTAGIALFLCEAYGAAHDPALSRAAAGALEQAIATRHRIPPEVRSSFYGGLTGLAYVALRAGQLLGREDLITRAAQLADEAVAGATVAAPADVISGLAGAIPPLLLLSRALGRPDLGGHATEWGARLVTTLRAQLVRPLVPDEERLLTGFAHGAAGIGWALCELHAVTNDPTVLAAAGEAFRYEERWLQPDRSNWGDLRDWDGTAVPPCQMAWCHGAPGIGLARLRAIELGGPECAHHAATAVRAALAAFRDPDADQAPDACLCHGWTGVAAVLLRAGEVLGDADARQCALRAAGRADRRVAAPGAWPVGLRTGSNPSLMVGLAGVGYFYLGLAKPGLPSVLTPGAGQTA